MGLKGQRIAIHATAKPSKKIGEQRHQEAKGLSCAYWPEGNESTEKMWWRSWRSYPFGAILGTGFVEDARKLTDADSKDALIDCGSVERYGLILSDIFKFDEPIPAKGAMGIWEWAPPKGLDVNG